MWNCIQAMHCDPGMANIANNIIIIIIIMHAESTEVYEPLSMTYVAN